MKLPKIAPMECTACGCRIADPEALFCPQCGVDLQRPDLCRACCKPLLPKANYCTRCGAPVEGVPESTATLPTRPPAAPRPDYRELYQVDEADWVAIDAGEYLMGSREEEVYRFDSERQHKVEVAPFQLLAHAVTFEMYDTFCRAERLPHPADEGWGRGQRPAINITYWSAVEYCDWLNAKTGWSVRLPSEAEWEYACRAGTLTPFHTGRHITDQQANFDARFRYDGGPKGEFRGKTLAVKSFDPNPWGLHDMHGNVWEWCASPYDERYTGLERHDAAHDRDDQRERVVRGGSWGNVAGGIRSASRNKLGPNLHFFKVGFRIARDT